MVQVTHQRPEPTIAGADAPQLVGSTPAGASPASVLPDTTVRMDEEDGFVPTTDLGRRLFELRRRIIASGHGLATDADFDRELAERRGGHSPGDDE